MHVSLQLTSRVGPDITEIRWTRGETTSRGIALAAELLRENYFFECSWREVGRSSRGSRPRGISRYKARAVHHALTFQLIRCARMEVCRGSSKGVSRNTVLTPSSFYTLSDKVYVTEAQEFSQWPREVPWNLARRSYEIASRFTHYLSSANMISRRNRGCIMSQKSRRWRENMLDYVTCFQRIETGIANIVCKRKRMVYLIYKGCIIKLLLSAYR